MKDIELWKMLVTVAIAVIGWMIGHYFNSRRDQELKRREIITTHLINAYRTLANDIANRGFNDDINKKMENLLSDIQLFGTVEQVKVADTLIDTVISGGEFDLVELINVLRNDLRKELGLKEVEYDMRFLRFKKLLPKK
jgi:hypothetical protein